MQMATNKKVVVSTGIGFLAPEMGRFKLDLSKLKASDAACCGTGVCMHVADDPCPRSYNGCQRRAH
jgi:hypothetical protein